MTSKGIEIFLKIISFGFLFVAVICGIGVWFFGLVNEGEESYNIPINAEISYMDRESLEAFVDYNYNGQTYNKIKINYYNNNFEIGEPIEVFIKSDNPQDAIVPGLGGGINIILIIVCIVNVVIFFVLYGVAISIKRRRKKLQKLYNKDETTYLVICELENDESNVFNGEYQKFIVCKVKGLDGKEIKIRSLDSYMGLSDSIIGKTIGVNLNYQNIHASEFLIDSIQ